MDEIKQHSPLKSILLHLIPGIVILTLIILFSQPVFSEFFRLNSDLSPVVGYLLALFFGLVLAQITLLLIAAKSEQNSFKIKNIINYRRKGKFIEYLIFIPVFILFFFVMFLFVAPLIQPYIVKTFFWYWPEEYNFQLLLQDPLQLAGYRGIKIILIAYIILSGLLGPFVEEIYFRGYLLPRMKDYAGRWAPLLNTVLFSLYHFFSPWENIIRIISLCPVIYLVWKKNNIRFSIIVHMAVNTLGGIIMCFIIFSQ